MQRNLAKLSEEHQRNGVTVTVTVTVVAIGWT